MHLRNSQFNLDYLEGSLSLFYHVSVDTMLCWILSVLLKQFEPDYTCQVFLQLSSKWSPANRCRFSLQNTIYSVMEWS